MKQIVMKLVLFIPMALLVCLSGCSYMVIGKYHYVTLNDTNHIAIAAKVTNRIGMQCYDGVLPAHLSLIKGAGYMRREKYEVLFFDEYNRCVAIDTIRFHRSKSYWANLFFLNYPGFLIVDPCTGAMWISSDTLMQPDLTQELSPHNIRLPKPFNPETK